MTVWLVEYGLTHGNNSQTIGDGYYPFFENREDAEDFCEKRNIPNRKIIKRTI